MKARNTWWLGLATGVGLAGAVAAALTAHYLHERAEYPKRLDVVEPGVLVRSGQPDANQFDHIRKHHHIRTVISLREESPQAGWHLQEDQWCQANGVRLVEIPIVEDIPSRQQVLAFLRAVRDGPSPALVHCELGRSRTGKMVAAYRIVVQDRPAEAAFQEMLAYGYHGEPDQMTQTQQWLAQLQRDRLSLLEAMDAPQGGQE